MAGIVEEIQRDALNSAASLSDVLRKARVVAAKLGQQQPLDWVDSELNGYEGEVPNYRIVEGQARVRNPYYGWQPIMFSGIKFQSTVCSRHMGNPVRELEYFASGKGEVLVPLPDELAADLCHSSGNDALPISVFLPRNGIIRILDIVRTKILDWSLSLQAAGIEGEGLSFSPAEKAMAHNPSITYQIGSIGTFAGTLGGSVGRDVHATATNAPAELEKAARLVEGIKVFDGDLGLPPTLDREMRAHVDALDQELRKPCPETGTVAGIVRSIRAIAENVAGNVFASGIVALASNIHL